MAPLKSSLARTVGKLLGVQKDRDLSLRGAAQSSRLPEPISATGGESTFTEAGYQVHVYYTGTPAPQKVFNVTSGTGTIECFLVGSGGSGAYDSGGGGGGGACVYGTNIPVNPSTNMAVVVGSAPDGITGYVTTPYIDYANSHNGKVSSIAHPEGTINAFGGNSGGNADPGYAANPFTPGVAPSDDGGTLGCGGGALNKPASPITAGSLLTPYPTPGAGTYNVYRNVGGSVPSEATAPWIGGGGGGAGGAGQDAGSGPINQAGNGGDGYDAATNIVWMTTSYGDSGVFGGGGGAGGNDGTPQEPGGTGGPGGGGDGTTTGVAPSGVANTGGGGGGTDDGSTTGGGGSGAVFIAYRI